MSFHAKRPDRVTLTGALVVLSTLVFADAGSAQLTLADNFRLREDDFDAISFAAGNQFGHDIAVCDFDADGFQDVAIGSPNADVFGVIPGAGAVHVAYGGADGLSTAGHQTLTQPAGGTDPPEEDDHLGTALAAGDFNGDGWCDLAVGASGETIDGKANAGAVHVFSGTDDGLTSTSQVLSENTPGVDGGAGLFDFFGRSLAAGDFDGDGFDDLAIGSDAAFDGGSVFVLFGTSEGLTGTGSQRIFEGPGSALGEPAPMLEVFGGRLVAGRFNDDPYVDLAIGTPTEYLAEDELGGVGAVHVFYGRSSGFDYRFQNRFDQSSLGLALEQGDRFGEGLAAGDFDGDGLDDLAVGSPGEGLGLPGSETPGAGQVAVLYATPSGLSTAGAQLWIQDSPGLSDQVEADDEFGRALAAGDFDGFGFDDLAIGVPLEDFEGGGHVDNGSVHVLYGTASGLSADGQQYHGQTVWNVGASENYDQFGDVMASGRFDAGGVATLVVGIPLEGVAGQQDAGLVAVITGTARPIFTDAFESGNVSAWSSVAP